MMNGFLHDVRYGFRILLKTPISLLTKNENAY